MKKLILFFAFLIGATCSYSQQLTTSSGGETTGTGGSTSYSIGQIAYSVYSDDTGTISEGVQQPYEIYRITGIKPNLTISNIKVYPNPTSNNLLLEISDVNQSLSYQLFNSSGILLKTQKDLESKTVINMDDISSNIYFLKIFDKNKIVSSFKIIKI